MAMQGQLSDQRLGNKYLLGELLAYGGFGEVYKAKNILLNRPQAIKVILERHLSEPRFRQRFNREAQTLAALNHPNILHVDDFEIEQERAYLVMPFINGGTLHDMLVQARTLSLTETEHYLTQICAALDYAHARNVVHLDLKPRNLLHQDGNLLLSDFGLAHLMKEGAVEGGTSLRFGSPHYMAPEQINGHPEARSDIYALGIILYQMLVGRTPFEGSTPEAVMLKQIMEPPPPLRTERPDLPPALGVVIAKALAKRPEERYATAGALLAAFNAALPSPPPPPPAQPSPPPPWYQLGRRDLLAVVLAAVLYLVIAGSAIASLSSPLGDVARFVLWILPFVMGILAVVSSRRKGFDGLVPALISGFAGGCVFLIIASALLGAVPIGFVLLDLAIYAFLSLLGATTYVGIKKLWVRLR